MQVAIGADGLTRRFGSKLAVENLRFAVNPGEVFGFLGPNGAGKTTTIKLLLGLLKPSGGKSEVLGFDSWTQGDKLRARTAVLFDEPGLYAWLTGPENVFMIGGLYGLTREVLQGRIRALMDVLQLAESDARQPSRKLSRGTRQKWGLCRVLALEPNVLFLDEPTSGLDPVAAPQIRQYLVDYSRKTQATIFLSTHNLEEATRICARVGVIHSGKLAALGAPAELRAGPRTWVIRYGGPSLDKEPIPAKIVSHGGNRLEIRAGNDEDIAMLVQWMIGRRRDIFEVRPIENSLESLFASLEEK